MNKLRIYIINFFFSSIIGAAIEVISSIFANRDVLDLSELFESMAKGAFIGTVSLFVFFYVCVKFRRKPVVGIMSNFTIVAALIAIDAMYNFITGSYTSINIKLVVTFFTAEILSLILTVIWYRHVNLYNDRLEKKKASIID